MWEAICVTTIKAPIRDPLMSDVSVLTHSVGTAPFSHSSVPLASKLPN